MKQRGRRLVTSLTVLLIATGAFGGKVVYADEAEQQEGIVISEEQQEGTVISEEQQEGTVISEEQGDEETVDVTAADVIEAAEESEVTEIVEASDNVDDVGENKDEQNTDEEAGVTDAEKEAVEETADVKAEEVIKNTETDAVKEIEEKMIADLVDIAEADADKIVIVGNDKLGGSNNHNIGWEKTDSGYMYYYGTNDGQYFEDGLYEIGGFGYWFDSNGIMLTNTWIDVGDGWIYASATGVLAQGMKQLGGQWYGFGENYLNSAGVYVNSGYLMKSNQIGEYNGKPYFFYKSGQMGTGWISYKYDYGGGYTETGYYYADPKSGVLKQGWLDLDNNRYHFGYPYLNSEDGYDLYDYNMESGGVYDLYGDAYYFATDGRLLTGWIKIPLGDGQVDYYYADKNEGSLKQGFATVDGKKYYFGDEWSDEEGTVHHSGYYMRKDGLYTFGNKGYYFSKNGDVQTGWIKETYTDWEDNVLERWYYADADGALAQKWKKINNTWYYFGYCYEDSEHKWITDGYEMVHMPWMIQGKPYYFSNSGAMRTGWIKSDIDMFYQDGFSAYTNLDPPGWLYADPNGVLQQGWVTIGGKKYFFGNLYYSDEPEGYQMLTGVIEYHGNGYFLSPSGILKENGWAEEKYESTDWEGNKIINSNWYYAGENGKLVKGWKKIGTKWYFFGYPYHDNETNKDMIDGYNMQPEGIITVNGKKYRLSDDGTLQTGFYRWSSFFYDILYYADANGVVQDGWLNINGKKIYCYDDGKVVRGPDYIDGKPYCFGDDGFMKTGWVQMYSDEWYYFGTDGIAADGWKTISGKKYYFSDGYMFKYFKDIDGVNYYFGSDGALVTGQAGWKKINYDIGYGKQIVEFYLNADGTLKTGWIPSGTEKYATGPNGWLIKNSVGDPDDSGKLYLFDETGKMITKTGWVKIVAKYTDYYGEEIEETRWYYLQNDYSVKKDDLAVIGGYTYCFATSNGSAVIGMAYGIYDQETHNTEYYLFDENGRMVTKKGWKQLNGNWYYVDGDGHAYCDGLYEIGGYKYYFDYYGVMLAGDSKGETTYSRYDSITGKYQYFKVDENGRLIQLSKGWNKLYDYDGNYNWYYLDDNGEPVSNTWVGPETNKYYTDAVGMMAVGSIGIDSKLYVFGADGKISKGGWVKVKNDYAYDGYSYYYANNDGTAYTGFITSGGKKYYIDNGQMKSDYAEVSENGKWNVYIMNSDGSIHTEEGFFTKKIKDYDYMTGEFITRDYICYTDKNGYAADHGWNTVNGNTYYFEYGKAVTGTQFINSDKYVFDSEGRLISKK